MRRLLPAPCLIALGVIAPLVLAACGGGSSVSAKPVDGVVEITMEDLRFVPDRIEVTAGTEITYRFRNAGAIPHEAFIGDLEAQESHEAAMSSTSMPDSSTMPEMTDDHQPAEPVIRLEPGETGTIEFTAERAGSLLIGCHEPGHWAAGMKATIDIK